MDSTFPQPQRLKHRASSLSSSSASKLPIKRKIPTPAALLLTPKPDPPSSSTASVHCSTHSQPSPSQPFKYQRVWTEPDEVRFLQGLLDSASSGLTFPRDLPLFYNNFSLSCSHPYTKSQLSEKLRRLRKKYRVVSTRVTSGLDPSLLLAHDRALFDLSTRLWGSEYEAVSPFSGGTDLELKNKERKRNDELGSRFEHLGMIDFDDGIGNDNDNNNAVRMDYGGGGGVAESLVRSILDVFDECLREVRVACWGNLIGGEKMEFGRRWKEQSVAEFDALARRLSLVLENSVNNFRH